MRGGGGGWQGKRLSTIKTFQRGRQGKRGIDTDLQRNPRKGKGSENAGNVGLWGMRRGQSDGRDRTCRGSITSLIANEVHEGGTASGRGSQQANWLGRTLK